MLGWRIWLCSGAVLAGLAVVIGAFGAHGADAYFAKKYQGDEAKSIAGFKVPTSWKRLQDFKTGAEYQMYHALGMVAVGLLLLAGPSKLLQVAGWSFLLGIMFFSGSLYVLTLTGQTVWGAVAPIGGTLFIVGWFALAAGAVTADFGRDRTASPMNGQSYRAGVTNDQISARIPTESRAQNPPDPPAAKKV